MHSVTINPTVLASAVCDECGAPATTALRGEDLFVCCQTCADKAQALHRAYLQAADVEDRTGSFMVAGGFNADDGSNGWCEAFTSYRAAEAFRRAKSEAALHRGGVYPYASDRVQERSDAAARAKAFRDAEKAEWASEEAGLDLAHRRDLALAHRRDLAKRLEKLGVEDEDGWPTPLPGKEAEFEEVNLLLDQVYQELADLEEECWR